MHLVDMVSTAPFAGEKSSLHNANDTIWWFKKDPKVIRNIRHFWINFLGEVHFHERP
jgi:hypothetical protein